jgi:hypothetical protein
VRLFTELERDIPVAPVGELVGDLRRQIASVMAARSKPCVSSSSRIYSIIGRPQSRAMALAEYR